jgi:ABC-2 type transport system permease protein
MYSFLLQKVNTMNLNRINTIVLHSWFHLSHSVETWIDLFWFSFVNVLVFGLITNYISQSAGTGQGDVLLIGLILWGVIIVSQYSITVGALWEIWSRSFSSLFITPLTMIEFIVGHMLGGLYKSVMVFLFTALLTLILYNFSIFSLGAILIIYFLELLIFGWTAGIFILGLIFRFGTNIQSFAWGLIFIVQPLAAVFYPLSVLPPVVRNISKIFPVTYVFESARIQHLTGVIDWNMILIATTLNILFFFSSFWFMQHNLKRGKMNGSFARMEG